MRKIIMAVCLTAMLLSGTSFYVKATKADTPELYNAEQSFVLAQNALLYIRILGPDDTLKSTGSGVILTPEGLAATAYHVVKGAQRIEAVLKDGRTLSPIKVLSYNEQADVAILQLPELKMLKAKVDKYQSLAIRDEAVRFGEKLFALGYPLKDTPVITEGIVNNPQAMINGRSRILTSAQIVSGMSGGPVLDQYGHLAGIISGSLRTMDNIHLVIDMNDLRKQLPKMTG